MNMIALSISAINVPLWWYSVIPVTSHTLAPHTGNPSCGCEGALIPAILHTEAKAHFHR